MDKFALFMCITVLSVSSAWSQDLSKADLTKCSIIPSEVMRLKCFDALAATSPEISSTQSTENWTIDSSSDEKLSESIEAITNSLDDSKKKKFEDAIQALIFSQIGNIFEAAANPYGMKRKIRDRLHGKTADEVISEHNRIITERRNKEREQAIGEIEETKKDIAELEQKQLNSERVKENLKKFKVIRSRFYFRETSFREEAIIELTVRNDYRICCIQCIFLWDPSFFRTFNSLGKRFIRL